MVRGRFVADEPRNSQVFAVVVYFARRRTGPFASGSKVGRHLPRLAAA